MRCRWRLDPGPMQSHDEGLGVMATRSRDETRCRGMPRASLGRGRGVDWQGVRGGHRVAGVAGDRCTRSAGGRTCHSGPAGNRGLVGHRPRAVCHPVILASPTTRECQVAHGGGWGSSAGITRRSFSLRRSARCGSHCVLRHWCCGASVIH